MPPRKKKSFANPGNYTKLGSENSKFDYSDTGISITSYILYFSIPKLWLIATANFPFCSQIILRNFHRKYMCYLIRIIYLIQQHIVVDFERNPCSEKCFCRNQVIQRF